MFQVNPVPYSSIYEDILQMDFKVIVTTNYDEYLEENFKHYSKGGHPYNVSRPETDNLINDLRSPLRSVVKMHGCITDPAKVVLDRLSYFETRKKNSGFFSAISALMTINTVLFVGYSINDPDIQLILENANLYNNSQNPHYALMSKFDHAAIRNANSHAYNIEFIEYPTGEHSKVPSLISDLRSAVIDFRTKRGIV